MQYGPKPERRGTPTKPFDWNATEELNRWRKFREDDYRVKGDDDAR